MFLNFGYPKTTFSPSEMCQRLGVIKGLKKGFLHHMTPVDLLSLRLRF